MRRVDRSWLQAAVAVLVGVGFAVLLGYGGIWPQASPGDTNVQMRHTLIVWSGFPAGSSQRPLVLSGARVLAPHDGFPTKTDKAAFANGAINAPSSYPRTPVTTSGYGLITATDAVALMSSTEATGFHLQITKVRLGEGTFQTDRGPRLLPAWLVWFAGVRTPAVVAAVRIFNPPGIPTSVTPVIRAAVVGANERTMTITFSTGDRPCGQYTLNVAESRTAVAVAVVGLRGRSAGCSALRELTATLGKPLGGRVLVDGLTGVPVSVAWIGQQPRFASRDPGVKFVAAARHRHLHRPVIRSGLAPPVRRV